MWSDYKKMCVEEGITWLGKQRFIKSRPYFIKTGSESDRINCACDICGNFYSLKSGVERCLNKPDIKTDELFAEFDEYLQDIRNQCGYKTDIEQFQKLESGRTGLTKNMYTSGEIADLLKNTRKTFENHRTVRNNDKLFSKKVDAPYLNNPESAIFTMDFSENMTIRHMRSSQAEFMQPISFIIHVTIIQYLSEKIYLYTVSDELTHKPEIPGLALKFAVQHVQEKFGVKLKHVLRRTDNCSEQYKSGMTCNLLLAQALDLELDILSVYGTPQHGKGEVDSAAGSAFKCLINRALLCDNLIVNNCRDGVNYVKNQDSKVQKLFQILEKKDLDDLVKKNRFIRSDVSRYSFPGIRDTYMMHFEPEHIFENGEMVHKYELPIKTVVSDDSSEGEQWQYNKFENFENLIFEKKNFNFFFKFLSCPF